MTSSTSEKKIHKIFSLGALTTELHFQIYKQHISYYGEQIVWGAQAYYPCIALLRGMGLVMAITISGSVFNMRLHIV